MHHFSGYCSLRTAYHFEVIFRAEAGEGAIFSTTPDQYDKMLSNFGFRAEGAKKFERKKFLNKVPKKRSSVFVISPKSMGRETNFQLHAALCEVNRIPQDLASMLSNMVWSVFSFPLVKSNIMISHSQCFFFRFKPKEKFFL